MKKSKKKQLTRVVIITGASQGIGFAAAEFFRKRGDTVYDISRTSGTDITDTAAVRAAFAKIHAEHGRIDILINNAGFGISGSAECTSTEDITKLFAVNFVGLAACCSAALPYMRNQAAKTVTKQSLRGRKKFKNRPMIINISSVAAIYALPFQSFYSASKSAVSGYTNALRTEIKPFKIRACAVLLGDVKTNFTAARKKSESDDPVYHVRRDRAMKRYETDESKGYSSAFVARKLYKLSRKKNPKPAHTFGFMFKFLVLASRLFPQRFLNWMVAKIYGI